LIVLAVVLCGCVAAGGAFLTVTGNFGVVEPGKVFRCSQPVSGLGTLIRTRKLASILNLRGGSSGDPWYVAEVEAARLCAVDFYDFPMSATRRPSRRELLMLIDLFGRCRYPLLIHCKSGSDRTGLASALYRMVVGGTRPEVALGEFTLRHGHVPVFGPEHLHEPLEEYSRWLAMNHFAHTPARFRRWVETEYKSADPIGSPPMLRPGPREETRRSASREQEPHVER
jgi:hypothetical protein